MVLVVRVAKAEARVSSEGEITALVESAGINRGGRREQDGYDDIFIVIFVYVFIIHVVVGDGLVECRSGRKVGQGVSRSSG